MNSPESAGEKALFLIEQMKPHLGIFSIPQRFACDASWKPCTSSLSISMIVCMHIIIPDTVIVGTRKRFDLCRQTQLELHILSTK